MAQNELIIPPNLPDFIHLQPSTTSSAEAQVTGVFTKVDLEEGYGFGPLEGEVKIKQEKLDADEIMSYDVHVQMQDSETQVSAQVESSWMKYVKHTDNKDQQNLDVQLAGGGVYFVTSRHIKTGEELLLHFEQGDAESAALMEAAEIGNGTRPFKYGKRPIESDKRLHGSVQRLIEDGKTPLEKGKTPLENGKTPLENGKTPLEIGKTPLENGKETLESEKRLNVSEIRLHSEQRPMENRKEALKIGRIQHETEKRSHESEKEPLENAKTPPEKRKLGVGTDVEFNGDVQVTETAPKKKTYSRSTGRKFGRSLFEAEKSPNKLSCDDLPKFRDQSWPPGFRTTVTLMRRFLEEHFGSPCNWTSWHFNVQKQYFTKVFNLEATASRSGNIYNYFKVSELSERCWNVANAYMDKFEKGAFGKKRWKGVKKMVYQSTFKALNSMKPIDNEEQIFHTLHDLLQNGPKKSVLAKTVVLGTASKGVQTLKETSNNCSTSLLIDDAIKNIKEKTEQVETLGNENTQLLEESRKMTNELSKVKQDLLVSQLEFAKIQNENTELMKVVEVELQNNTFLCKQNIEKTQRIENLMKEVEKTRKELSEIKEGSKSK